MPATSVAVATSSTTLMESSTGRAGFDIQNPSANANKIWINLNGGTATAAPPNYELSPGQDFSWVGNGKITAIAETGSTTVTVIER